MVFICIKLGSNQELFCMIFSMTQVDLMLLLMKTGKCYLKNNKEASNFAFSFYKSRVLSLFYNVLISRRTV